MNSEPSSGETQTTGHVLVVDDDPISRSMAAHVLGKAGFQVSTAESGEACLQLVGELRPDFILLDIQMPGMNGYETCRLLRAQPETRDIQIVFVSGNDSLDDRIQAYEVGADDFISKPVSVAELRHKACKLMAYIAAHRAETSAPDDAAPPSCDGIAQLAMQSLQESNVVLSFTRGTLNCRTLEALATLTINSLRSYGLQSQVQLRSDFGTITQSERGLATPLEEQIFNHVLDQGRLFQFQKRLVANYDHCSILVANMPVDDADYCGRIRDYVAMIAEAGSAAVDNIVLRLDAIRRADTLRDLAQNSRLAIADLRQRHLQQQEEIYRELDQTVENVENMYYHLGLTDKQENIISDLTRSSRDRVISLVQQGQAFDHDLAEIIDALASNLDQSPSLEAVEESGGEDELWF